MDEIRIDNLEIYAHHGVYEQEKERGQFFAVNAVLYLDLRQAGQTDRLRLSVDYGEVCHFINRFFRGHTYRLLETAAEHLAEALLSHFPRLEQVSLEILKPHAPIGLPFGSVSVKVCRGWHTAYLSLGSNMGNREKYLEGAVRSLFADHHNREIRVSDWMETEPYGYTEQNAFINGAAVMKTLYTPTELLDRLHEIEREAGRERTIRWGPRTLDLDLVFYDNLISEDAKLTIPHPDMQNRMFVLEPLAQLCPGKVHPVFQKTVGQLKRELGDSHRIDGRLTADDRPKCANPDKGHRIDGAPGRG